VRWQSGHSPPLDDEGVFLEALPLVADVLLATAPLLDEGVLPLPLLPPPPVEFGVFLCAGLYSGSEPSPELRSSDESSGLGDRLVIGTLLVGLELFRFRLPDVFPSTPPPLPGVVPEELFLAGGEGVARMAEGLGGVATRMGLGSLITSASEAVISASVKFLKIPATYSGSTSGT